MNTQTVQGRRRGSTERHPLSLAIAAALYDPMPQGMDVAMFRVQLWGEYGLLL